MRGAIREAGSERSASKDSSPLARSEARAFSTLDHDVFWVRIAPTQTSNGVFAGHQPACPRARRSLR